MSQAELAAGRCSKEYVSQIERGKSRPSPETVAWLAERLGTDPGFLEHGVSSEDVERLDSMLRDAEHLVENHRYDDALRAFEAAHEVQGSDGSLRLLKGEAWARIRTGELDEAMRLLETAADEAVAAGSTDLDRAEVVFRVGVVRYQQSRIADAIVLFDNALALTARHDALSDQLRSDLYHWRSRCHRRNRDWVAAQEDIERALELAEAATDTRRIADALFQASLVAQRRGSWLLARAQAERARDLFASLGDRATVARLLNNLAGLNHLLGNDEQAIALLDEAFAGFVDLELPVEAGYVCASLSEIRLERGDEAEAEEQARKALGLLAGRVDHLQEVGTAQLALGRALAAQGSLDEGEASIAAAEQTFERAESLGHRSYAWIAQGDVESRRGNDAGAATLYRRAAQALRDPDH